MYIINGYDLKSIKQLYRILMSRKSDIKEYCKLYEEEAARKCWDLFEKCIFKGMDRTSAELYELGRLCDPHESSKLKKRIFKSIIVRKLYNYSNKNFILKYFRCRDGKRTETRIGMEGICITHSCIPLYTVYMQHIMAHSGGMQEWVIQIPSIPILVSVLFPSLHLKYFRIKFLLLVCIVFMRMRTKPHPHPVIS